MMMGIRPRIALTKEANTKLKRVAPDGRYNDVAKPISDTHVAFEIDHILLIHLLHISITKGYEIEVHRGHPDFTEVTEALVDEFLHIVTKEADNK